MGFDVLPELAANLQEVPANPGKCDDPEVLGVDFGFDGGVQVVVDGPCVVDDVGKDLESQLHQRRRAPSCWWAPKYLGWRSVELGLKVEMLGDAKRCRFEIYNKTWPE